MTALELLLRLSIIRATLDEIAADSTVAPDVARAAAHAARTLASIRPSPLALATMRKICN